MKRYLFCLSHSLAVLFIVVLPICVISHALHLRELGESGCAPDSFTHSCFFMPQSNTLNFVFPRILLTVDSKLQLWECSIVRDGCLLKRICDDRWGSSQIQASSLNKCSSFRTIWCCCCALCHVVLLCWFSVLVSCCGKCLITLPIRKHLHQYPHKKVFLISCLLRILKNL